MINRLISIIFIAFSVLYTEGGYAQGFFEKKDVQPSIPDSLIFDEMDVIDSATVLLSKNNKSPYSDAEKQYLSQPIESKNIDKMRWEQAKSGIDYSSDKLEKQKTDKTNNTPLNPMWVVVFEFLKWFFIVGAVVLVAYLILRFVGEGNIFGTKKRRISDPSVKIDLEHIEENLDTAELDPLIRQAITDKNFTLAVRLYYLAILKELHIKGDIAWKKDKTNRTYLREMRENPFFEPFRNATSIFERVWYGSQSVDERNFTMMQPDFQNLLKSLR